MGEIVGYRVRRRNDLTAQWEYPHYSTLPSGLKRLEWSNDFNGSPIYPPEHADAVLTSYSCACALFYCKYYMVAVRA